MDHSETELLTNFGVDLLEPPTDLDLIPVPADIRHQVDVMKGDQARRFDKWCIHLEIALNTGIRVVAIDQEKVESLIADKLADLREHGRIVRVVTDQFETLARQRECAKRGSFQAG